MPLALKPGTRLFSAVCTTEMIVVKAPPTEVDLTIGGAAPVTDANTRGPESGIAAGHDGGSLLGKRYVDESETVELLCTKAGDGSPAISGTAMSLKEAKPLPASD